MKIPQPPSVFRKYVAEEIRILRSLPIDYIESAFNVVQEAAMFDRHVFLVGNGGGAANASHFAMELSKNAARQYPRIRVSSLNDNVALMTAIANDISFEDIFVHPLKGLAHTGDVLIALSTSGKSKNVLKAVEWANQHKLCTISVTGNQLNDLSQMAKIPIVIPTNNSSHIENMQQTICHMMIDMFDTRRLYGVLG